MINIRHAERLNEVHPDLVRIINAGAAMCSFPIVIIQGLRTVEEEKQNVASGASQTMHSRHLPGAAGFACAVDVGCEPGGVLSWEYSLYVTLAECMKAAAQRESVPLEWGGDWKTLKDGGHYQLPWAQYP